MTFEEGNKELDDIIEKLESGKVGLKEGAKLFERGSEISEALYKEFNESKGKIFVIRDNLEKLMGSEEWFAFKLIMWYNIFAKV